MIDAVLPAAAIIGLVNGLRLYNSNREGFMYFVIAMLASIGAGALGWFGIQGLEQGFLVGLASSGLYRTAQKVSGE